MKVNVNLGVATAKELKKPHDCFSLGKETAMLSDGLVFAEFLFHEPKAFTKTELGLIAAGVKSTGGIAFRMTYKNIPAPVIENLKAYSRTADALNKKVRQYIDPKKDGTPNPEFTPEDRKSLERSIQKLRVKANEMVDTVEKLCYVEKKPATKAAVSGNVIRAGMAGTPIAAPPEEPRRRFVYPKFSSPPFHKNRRRT